MKVKEVPFKMVILLQRAGLIQVKSHDILLDYANQTKIVDYWLHGASLLIFSSAENSLMLNVGSQIFLLNLKIYRLFILMFHGMDKTEKYFLSSHFKMSRFHESWSS